MLWGLLGASIPIIIHMTNRTRAKRKPFAALDFLLLSDKRLARKLKTKQLLVLALRVLLLAAIPLALAKPYISHPQTGELNTSSPGSVVIILDNSLSMRRVHAEKTDFERALKQAADVIRESGPQTNFAIVTAARPVTVVTGGLTYDRGELQLALEKVRSLESTTHMTGALKEAERILSASELPLRQVIILSDHTMSTWGSVKDPWSLKEIPKVITQTLREEQAPKNVAITDVEVNAQPHLGTGTMSAEVMVLNLSPDSVVTTLELQIAGETLRQKVELLPEKETSFSFQHRTEAFGLVRGSARVTLEDDLSDDNRYFFTVDLGSTTNVLLVNGAPRDERYLDELFFLKPALGPSDESIRARVVTADDLKGEVLNGVDVVYLANVGGLTPQQRLTLEKFVEGGGGLFVAVGDQLTERSVRSYGKLLPAPIRSFKEVVRRESPSAEPRALRIATVDADHPLMVDFARTSLFRSLVYQYALLGSEGSETTGILARFSNGTPAMIESKLGLGRVLLLTTTIDRDWSDFAMRSSFLPLMQTATVYLAGRLGNMDQPRTIVTQPVMLKEPPGEGPLVIEQPDGMSTAVASDGRGSVRFAKTMTAGHYELKRQTNSEFSVPFSVNVDRRDSRLVRGDLAAINETLMVPGRADAPRGQIDARPGSEAPDPFRSDVWPFVLVALFGLLLAETWVVIRGVR